MRSVVKFKAEISAALISCLLLPQQARANDQKSGDITSLSIQELMNIEVTSVSKRKEKLVSAPAAITVLTPDDIRRSGATTIAEALRLVPGLNVARFTGNKWGVTARGFNSRFANKLLVLVDGRTVYTTTFSGVYWDAMDYPLDDIDRIEVIRGPGATMWGSNAVNGVIQIFTKHSKNSAGVSATHVSGNIDRGVTDLRQGFWNGKAGFRVWARSSSREPMESLDGYEDNTRNRMIRGGFRFDFDRGERDKIFVSGDVIGTSGYTRVLDRSFEAPYTFGKMFLFNHSAGNVVTRWTHEYKNGAATQVQLYYDRYRRNEESLDSRQTADFDLQHTFAQRGSHTLQAGIGYRHSWDYLPSETPWVRFSQAARSDFLGSGFVQDEIALGDTRWKLLVGTRFEKNNYTGFEIQPGVRLNYEWSPTRSLWGAISRSVRTPSRFEHDVTYVVSVQPVAPGFNAVAAAMGTPTFKAEGTVSYSAGYREQLSSKTSVDVSGFVNRLTGLRGTEMGQPYPTVFASRPVLFLPFNFRNSIDGYTYGGEATIRRQLLSSWKLSGSYSYLGTDLKSKSPTTVTPQDSANVPTHSLILDSRFDLKHGWQFDLFAYATSRFTGPAGNAFFRPIPGHIRTDARIGKKLPGGFELSVIGQNLTNPRRVEGIPEANEIGTYQRRAVAVRLEYRFSPGQ